MFPSCLLLGVRLLQRRIILTERRTISGISAAGQQLGSNPVPSVAIRPIGLERKGQCSYLRLLQRNMRHPARTGHLAMGRASLALHNGNLLTPV